MNHILQNQLLVALKRVATNKWATTSAVANALQLNKLHLSHDSVGKYLKKLREIGMVVHKFEDDHNHWMLTD